MGAFQWHQSSPPNYFRNGYNPFYELVLAFSYMLCSRKGLKYEGRVYSLWFLLHFAKLKRVNKIQVMSDLKVVINWENYKCNIENIILQHILLQIWESLQQFQWTNFTHIYKELNTKVDEISLEALSMHLGTFYFVEFITWKEIEAMAFHSWPTCEK